MSQSYNRRKKERRKNEIKEVKAFRRKIKSGELPAWTYTAGGKRKFSEGKMTSTLSELTKEFESYSKSKS